MTWAETLDSYRDDYEEMADDDREALEAEVTKVNNEAADSQLTAIITLTCHCCLAETRGRQWWNRDTGFGTCPKCGEWLISRGEDAEFLTGQRGTHWDIKEIPPTAPTYSKVSLGIYNSIEYFMRGQDIYCASTSSP